MGGDIRKICGPIRVPQLTVATFDQERCQRASLSIAKTCGKHGQGASIGEICASTRPWSSGKEPRTRDDERRRSQRRLPRQHSLLKTNATTSFAQKQCERKIAAKTTQAPQFGETRCHLPIHYHKKRGPEFVKFILETPRT